MEKEMVCGKSEYPERYENKENHSSLDSNKKDSTILLAYSRLRHAQLEARHFVGRSRDHFTQRPEEIDDSFYMCPPVWFYVGIGLGCIVIHAFAELHRSHTNSVCGAKHADKDKQSDKRSGQYEIQ